MSLSLSFFLQGVMTGFISLSKLSSVQNNANGNHGLKGDVEDASVHLIQAMMNTLNTFAAPNR